MGGTGVLTVLASPQNPLPQNPPNFLHSGRATRICFKHLQFSPCELSDRGSSERKGPPPPLILNPTRLSPVSPELSPLSGILRQKKGTSGGGTAQTQSVTFAGSPTMSRSSTSSLPRELSGTGGGVTKSGVIQGGVMVGVPTVEVSPPFAMQLSPKSRKSVSPSLLRRALSPSLRRRNKIRNSKRSHSTGNVDMCNGCGFPILEESMVSAQGSRYHTSCFRCTRKQGARKALQKLVRALGEVHYPRGVKLTPSSVHTPSSGRRGGGSPGVEQRLPTQEVRGSSRGDFAPASKVGVSLM
ncbi:hypothetical protein EGW08_009373 [Elysia chlorotica]|uniref:LIM zinc-binding domain-containing protein n=1 Tax=Elysia chlorotica TaxID=188477 RepID=A0A3S0ZPQ6_ELYCH|nr:hypothetical protein EGW08_009373 [Elysia chlorotica]